MKVMRTNCSPNEQEWRRWELRDLISYYLSREAARKRLRSSEWLHTKMDRASIEEFCKPVRAVFHTLYGGDRPIVSLVIPAYNEESELLPTLLSLTLLDVEPGVLEIIVADNNSKDRTRAIVESCGAKYCNAEEQGVGYARLEGLQHSSSTAEYIWFSDADTRVVPPIRLPYEEVKSPILRTNLRFMNLNEDYIGISSGAVYETTHWLHRTVRRLGIIMRKTRPVSCWSGPNQFMRKQALLESGGINPRIIYGEDPARLYQLARYAKPRGLHLADANSMPEWLDPVYCSGRRHGTLHTSLRHLLELRKRRPLPRDQHGYPIHPEGEKFRNVRPDLG